MAKDKHGNGLVYDGDTSSVSYYTMWLKDRKVFRIWVDNKDHMFKLHAMSINKPWKQIDLGISATLSVEENRISSSSVQVHVYSMLPFIMADLYIHS